MKKTIIALISVIGMSSSYAYTLGESYNETNTPNESNNKVTIVSNVSPSNKSFNSYNNTVKTSLMIKNNQIVGINSEGNELTNLKESLGKYYDEYHTAWLERKSQQNHQSATIDTEHLHIVTYSIGNKIFYSQLELKQP